MKKWLGAHWKELVTLLLAFCILAPMLVMGWYDRPAGDDFDYTSAIYQARVSGGGFLAMVKAAWDSWLKAYRVWQGTFSSNLLDVLQPGAWFGEKAYRITPFFIMGLSWLLLYAAINLANRRYLKKGRLASATAALGILALMMCWEPYVVETFYWWNGAVNYIPGFFAAIYAAGLALDVAARWQTGEAHRVRGLVGLLLLSFVTSGFAHQIAFLNLMLQAILCGRNLLKRKKLPIALAPFLAAAAGFLVMYLAPGTGIRMASEGGHDAIWTVKAVFNKAISMAPQLFSVQWILSLAVLFPAVCYLVRHLPEELLPRRFPLVGIILSEVVFCGVMAVPYYAMGHINVGRVIDAIVHTFWLMSWVDVFLLVGYLHRRQILNIDRLPFMQSLPMRSVAAGVCLALLVFMPQGEVHSNPWLAVKDFFDGYSMKLAAKLDERFEKFNDPTLTEVGCEPLGEEKLATTYICDLEAPDEGEYPNRPLIEYYGKNIYLIVD